MAQIFISYSRSDRPFLDNFILLVRRVYGNDSLWYDDDIHGGADWWQMILDEVGKCELFIYLVSNESLESPYCQAELREALRLHKQILPVVVRRLKPDYPGNIADDLQPVLRRTQYVDLTSGFKDANLIATLYAAIHRLLQQAPPQSIPPQSPQPIPQPPVPDKKSSHWLTEPWAIILAAIITGVFVILAALIANGDDDNPRGGEQNPPPTTAVALIESDTPTDEPPQTPALTLTPTGEPSHTPTLTSTTTPSGEPTVIPSPTDTLTQAPTLSEVENEGTIQAEIAAILTERFETQAAIEQLTYAAQAADAQAASDSETRIALSWTPVPTVDARATAEARLTQTQETVSAQATADAQMTSGAEYIQSIGATATSLALTLQNDLATGTANFQATQNALATEIAAQATADTLSTATQQAQHLTATATLWTKTPTSTATTTYTLSPTPAQDNGFVTITRENVNDIVLGYAIPACERFSFVDKQSGYFIIDGQALDYTTGNFVTLESPVLFPYTRTNQGEYSSPDGEYVVEYEDQVYYIYKANGDLHFSVTGSTEDDFYKPVFSNDSQYLSLIIETRVTRAVPPQPAVLVYELNSGERLLYGAASFSEFSSDSTLVLAYTNVYSLPDGTFKYTIEDRGTFSPNGDLIASYGGKLHDSITGHTLFSIPSQLISFSGDQKVIFSYTNGTCLVFGNKNNPWPYRSGLIQSSGVNIRSQPRTNSDVVSSATGRLAVFARTLDAGWYKILYASNPYLPSDSYGWVSASVVEVISMPEEVPVENE